MKLFLLLVCISVTSLNIGASPNSARSRASQANDEPQTRTNPNFPRQTQSNRMSLPYQDYPGTTRDSYNSLQDPIMPAHEHRPFSFNYLSEAEDGMSSHQQVGDQSGKVVGSYMISLADGRKRIVDYIADENGFRANVRTNEPGTSSQESPADAVFYSEGNAYDYDQNRVGSPLSRSNEDQLPPVRSNVQQPSAAPRRPTQENWNRRFANEPRTIRNQETSRSPSQDDYNRRFANEPRTSRNDESLRRPFVEYGSQPSQADTGSFTFPLHRRDPAPELTRDAARPTLEQGNQTEPHSQEGQLANVTGSSDVSGSRFRGRPSQDIPLERPVDNEDRNQGVDRSSTVPSVTPDYRSHFRQGRQPSRRANTPQDADDNQPGSRRPVFGDRREYRNPFQPQPSYNSGDQSRDTYRAPSNVPSSDDYNIAGYQRGGAYNPTQQGGPLAQPDNTVSNDGDALANDLSDQDQNKRGRPSLTSYFFRNPVRNEATAMRNETQSFSSNRDVNTQQGRPRNAQDGGNPIKVAVPEDSNENLNAQTDAGANLYQPQPGPFAQSFSNERPNVANLRDDPRVNNDMPFYHYQSGPDYYFRRS